VTSRASPIFAKVIGRGGSHDGDPSIARSASGSGSARSLDASRVVTRSGTLPRRTRVSRMSQAVAGDAVSLVRRVPRTTTGYHDHDEDSGAWRAR
jgi:hypothetical protein